MRENAPSNAPRPNWPNWLKRFMAHMALATVATVLVVLALAALRAGMPALSSILVTSALVLWVKAQRGFTHGR